MLQDKVGGRDRSLVVDSEHALLSRVDGLLHGFRELDRRLPLIVLPHRGELVDPVERCLTMRGHQSGAHAVGKPSDQGIRVHAVSRRFLLDLRDDLPDHELVELV